MSPFLFMEAKVTRQFYGAADGCQPRIFKVDEIITGSLAEAAIAAGDAVSTKKRQAPAPDNLKTSSASQPAPASQERTAKKRRGRPRKSSS